MKSVDHPAPRSLREVKFKLVLEFVEVELIAVGLLLDAERRGKVL